MNSSFNPYAVTSVSETGLETRTEFVRKTYTHLAGAIGAFALLEWLLLKLVPPTAVMGFLSLPFSWVMVLAAFMGVSWLANKWAYNGASKQTQYAGLGLYVVAEALIFLPLMYMALAIDPMIIGKAAVVTGALVLGLTAIAFTTRKDFSFLGGFLKIAFIVALVVVLAGALIPGFGAGLGMWFSIAMILLCAGSVLYNTSNIMYHYAPGQHVAAALSLFASIATMFWYMIRLFMSRNN